MEEVAAQASGQEAEILVDKSSVLLYVYGYGRTGGHTCPWRMASLLLPLSDSFPVLIFGPCPSVSLVEGEIPSVDAGSAALRSPVGAHVVHVDGSVAYVELPAVDAEVQGRRVHPGHDVEGVDRRHVGRGVRPECGVGLLGRVIVGFRASW